jgi:hypothetical protein
MKSPTSSLFSWGRMGFAVLAAALIPAMIAAQGTPGPTLGRVSGTVADMKGKALAGAAVTLSSESSDLRRTATTDKKGAYRFDDVPVGPYQVTAELSAFVSTTRAAAVTEKELNVGLRFFLIAAGGEIVRAPRPDRAPRPTLVVPFWD